MINCISSRQTCRLCEAPNLYPAISLPASPIADKYPDSPSLKQALYPLDLYQCRSCGHVQTINVLPLSLLFDSDYTYKPSKNSSLVEHFNDYADALVRVAFPPKKSLDIGSNDGLFLSILRDKYGTEIIGIDPAFKASEYANNNDVFTINKFFTYDYSNHILKSHGHFDHVSANNVYAHNDDLSGFTKGISNLLSDGGIFSFEISYLLDIVDKCLLGTIFHEHLSHHSLSPLIPFLAKYDLHLFHAQRVDTQGGALICFASKSTQHQKSDSLLRLLSEEAACYATSSAYMDSFRQKVISTRSLFHSLLNKKLSSNTRIIVFGAARSTNFLIEFFQLSSLVDECLDDNHEKIYKYLPNSHVMIKASSCFEFQPKDVVIPLAWVHTNRIVERLRSLNVPVSVLCVYPEITMIDLS